MDNQQQDSWQDALEWVMWLALIAVPPLAAHQFALLPWTLNAPELHDLWTGFRSIAIHVADYPALLALLMGLLLRIFSKDVRLSQQDSTLRITRGYGGFLWILLVLWSTFHVDLRAQV